MIQGKGWCWLMCASSSQSCWSRSRKIPVNKSAVPKSSASVNCLIASRRCWPTAAWTSASSLIQSDKPLWKPAPPFFPDANAGRFPAKCLPPSRLMPWRVRRRNQCSSTWWPANSSSSLCKPMNVVPRTFQWACFIRANKSNISATAASTRQWPFCEPAAAVCCGSCSCCQLFSKPGKR